ncbi:methyltransferase domain-containing protein [Azospirillum sp. YIM B02556]|uniref:Methyltransferase domain-containing protein n=1 Tax=Azospirillum endophyticum TaxID=2800326 RepID=A0ABS1FBG4_9PROT|nr:methyltransferase domain-containing protein [Azospirillum endophyticum]MBK1840739.1 methyltransferase domain-containing protein [Azospirillum endophyticum]
MPQDIIDLSCNICGGTIFGPGPVGRMSDTGKPPHCTRCGSLERHRANRALFQSIPIGALSWRRALQFSPDMALNKAWFQNFEVSVYGGENSLDIQNINRPDASYDFVSLSHVLEFVPNDHESFSELMRILSPKGILHLVLSQPLSRPHCIDFSSATGIHQYFHLYGQDFEKRFSIKEHGFYATLFNVMDPITEVTETIHVISKSKDYSQKINEAIIFNSRHIEVSEINQKSRIEIWNTES